MEQKTSLYILIIIEIQAQYLSNMYKYGRYIYRIIYFYPIILLNLVYTQIERFVTSGSSLK